MSAGPSVASPNSPSHNLELQLRVVLSSVWFGLVSFGLGSKSWGTMKQTRMRTRLNLVFNFIFARATLKNSRWIKLFKMSNNYSNANGTVTLSFMQVGRMVDRRGAWRAAAMILAPGGHLLCSSCCRRMEGKLWFKKILVLFTVALVGFVLYAKQHEYI